MAEEGQKLEGADLEDALRDINTALTTKPAEETTTVNPDATLEARGEQMVSERKNGLRKIDDALRGLVTNKELLSTLQKLGKELPIATYHLDPKEAISKKAATELSIAPDGSLHYYPTPESTQPIVFRLVDIDEQCQFTNDKGEKVSLQYGVNNAGLAPVNQTRTEFVEHDRSYSYDVFLNGGKGFVVTERTGWGNRPGSASSVPGEPFANYRLHHNIYTSGEQIMQSAVNNLRGFAAQVPAAR